MIIIMIMIIKVIAIVIVSYFKSIPGLQNPFDNNEFFSDGFMLFKFRKTTH